MTPPIPYAGAIRIILAIVVPPFVEHALDALVKGRLADIVVVQRGEVDGAADDLHGDRRGRAAVSPAYFSSTIPVVLNIDASCLGSVKAAPIVRTSRSAKKPIVALGIGPAAGPEPNIRANIVSFVMAALMLTHVVPTSLTAPWTDALFSSEWSSSRSHALSIKFAAE